MHVAMTAIFDPSTMPAGYELRGRCKDFIASRLHLVPPFRRRVVEVPFRLNHPIWVEDPDFDLDYHIRRIGAPAPGGHRELAELAAQIASTPLDRSRPLWELYVVEGLADGNIGVVTKMHHCAVDGVSGRRADGEPLRPRARGREHRRRPSRARPSRSRPTSSWSATPSPRGPVASSACSRCSARRPAPSARSCPATAIPTPSSAPCRSPRPARRGTTRSRPHRRMASPGVARRRQDASRTRSAARSTTSCSA